MITFKLLKSSVSSVRVNQRQISGSSGRLLGVFKDDTKQEETTFDIMDFEEEDLEEKQRRINKIRNKSGLLRQHRLMLNDVPPYANSESWVHETLKYKRKIYAKYGSESNIDPKICFWTKKELAEKNEYERVAFPHTVQEMMNINEQQRREKRESILAREAEVFKNLGKLDQWKKDIKLRAEKKETDARIAKERKDRLIEEVRKHFGYTIDPRDDRFKELLIQKEKEQRKKMKESKRQDNDAKMLAKLLSSTKKPEAEKSENIDDAPRPH